MRPDAPSRTPNSFLVVVAFAAAFVLVGLIAIIAVSRSRPTGETVEHRRAMQRIETRTRLEKESQEKLGDAGWVDKAKGVVHVPISDAITSVVGELSQKKPTRSQLKVEAPLPMPVIDPNSTEPPPFALPSAPQGADTIRFAALESGTPPAPAGTAPAPAAIPSKPERAPAKAEVTPSKPVATEKTAPSSPPSGVAPSPSLSQPAADPLVSPSPLPMIPKPPAAPSDPAISPEAPVPSAPVTPASPAPGRPPLIDQPEPSEPAK